MSVSVRRLLPGPAIVGVLCFLLFGGANCLYDPQKPCGHDQEPDERGLCVCSDGSKPDLMGGGCKAPGALAADGGAKPGPLPPPVMCDPAIPGQCPKTPTGQGKMCASDADCAGLEARFCEIYSSKVCLVDTCKVGDPSACSEGWLCCDVSHLGLPKILCTPGPKCP